jgi:hypothetical protein
LNRFDYTCALARFHYVLDDKEVCARFVFDTFLGTRQLAKGSVHGMNIFVPRRESVSVPPAERILVVNEDQTVPLMDLNGSICWQQ